MDEWDVAGRCCAGCGWWCAMAWIFWCYGFHTSAAEFCKFNQTAEKIIAFHAIWGLCWYNFLVCHLNKLYIFFFAVSFLFEVFIFFDGCLLRFFFLLGQDKLRCCQRYSCETRLKQEADNNGLCLRRQMLKFLSVL